MKMTNCIVEPQLCLQTLAAQRVRAAERASQASPASIRECALNSDDNAGDDDDDERSNGGQQRERVV